MYNDNNLDIAVLCVHSNLEQHWPE